MSYREELKREIGYVGGNALGEHPQADYRDMAINAAVAEVERLRATVDTCEHGHKFARLKVHPMRDGRPRCPHCMAIGLDNLYAEQVLAGSEFIDVEPLLARLKEHLSDPAFDAGERDYTQSLINRITAKRHLDEERRRLRF